MSEKKYVLITGATGGIGKALCQVFTSAGYTVIGSDCTVKDCVCDYFIQADLFRLVNEKEYQKDVINKIRQSLDGDLLNAIVNNAAVQLLGNAGDLSIDDFRLTHDVNTVAPLILIKQFLPDLEQTKGAVVNIGSIHSKLTKPGFISYASSKSALEGLTRSMAVDLGGKIRINTVRPAATETEMLKMGFSGDQQGYESLKDYHPVKRIAYAEEIASAALYLLSEEAAFISGSTFSIDGAIGCRLHDPE